jgi:hypothetical protein
MLGFGGKTSNLVPTLPIRSTLSPIRILAVNAFQVPISADRCPTHLARLIGTGCTGRESITGGASNGLTARSEGQAAHVESSSTPVRRLREAMCESARV